MRVSDIRVGLLREVKCFAQDHTAHPSQRKASTPRVPEQLRVLVDLSDRWLRGKGTWRWVGLGK